MIDWQGIISYILLRYLSEKFKLMGYNGKETFPIDIGPCYVITIMLQSNLN